MHVSVESLEEAEEFLARFVLFRELKTKCFVLFCLTEKIKN